MVATSNGWSTLITANEFHIKPEGELHVFVVYKNLSDKAATLLYRTMSQDDHTYWSLDVTSPGGSPVKAAAHPRLTKADITDYFSRFPRSYEITIEPGESYYYTLGRINTAAQGWGYKEDLDFRYYPMTEKGRYGISATTHHLGTVELPVARGLSVWIQ